MAEQNEVLQVARERAEASINKAIGALHEAAQEIGAAHGIPENIAGHSVSELLGRMAYVPSMARDLRRTAGQELAKLEIEKTFVDPTPEPTPAPKIDKTKLPPAVNPAANLVDLDGVSPMAAKALKAAGIVTVGDAVAIPDAHLVKINGMGEKSVAQLRQAISGSAR